jgi:hypothetical protein
MYVVEALEAGLVTGADDGRVHAVRMSLHGLVAVCGAGRIAAGVLGRFGDVRDDEVCLACFAAALPTQRSAT